MPGGQDQQAIALNIGDYPKQRDDKCMKVMRLQAGKYQLVVRQFNPGNGKPADPLVLPIDRDGCENMAKGLEEENKKLQASIDHNVKAIEHLRKTIPADMDVLDAAAKSAGDE